MAPKGIPKLSALYTRNYHNIYLISRYRPPKQGNSTYENITAVIDKLVSLRIIGRFGIKCKGRRSVSHYRAPGVSTDISPSGHAVGCATVGFSKLGGEKILFEFK